MKKRIEQLAENRELLVSKAAIQRAELAEVFAPLRVPLGYADQGLSAYRFLAQYTTVVTAGVAALAALIIPKRWSIWLDTGWLAWRMLLAAKRKLSN